MLASRVLGFGLSFAITLGLDISRRSLRPSTASLAAESGLHAARAYDSERGTVWEIYRYYTGIGPFFD